MLPKAEKPQPWKPHAYQKRAVKWLLETACAGLLLDPGLGKTSITLAAIRLLKKQGLLSRALIVAPLRPCYMVWPAEVRKWAEFGDLRVQILHGKHKEEALEADADIYLINPEGLQWLLDGGRFKRLGADTLVIDESSKFKSTNALRFKLLKPFLPKFARRWILTGTPAPNGLLDLFGQMYILDLGNALGRFVTHYRSRFFYPSGFGGFDWKLQEGAEQEIQEAIRPLVLRLKDEDYLTLPQIVTNVIKVALPPAARKIYDDLEEELIAEIGDAEVVTAATAAAASIKCRQVANGALYRTPEPGTVLAKHERWELVHNDKLNALVDLLDELQGQPVLIAYDFRHDLERLLAVLGADTPHIGSGVSMARTLEIEAAWNRGELPWLLGHPASMGHGLNLQGAGNHVAWFANTWDLELYDQFNRRVRRQGNRHSHVFVHHFVAEDTVEERMLRVVGKKGRTQADLMDALRIFVKNRKRGSFSSLSGSEKDTTLQSLGWERPTSDQEEEDTMNTQVQENTVKVGTSAKGTVKAAGAKAAGKSAPKPEKAAAAAGAKAATTKAPKTAAPKAEKPAPAPKAAKGKVAAPAPAPEPTEGRGRPSPYAGHTIVKNIKTVAESGLREGSKRAVFLEAVLKAKKFDDVLGLEVEVDGETRAIGSGNIAFMVEKGWVSVG